MRGHARAQQRARIRRLEAEAREMDLVTDPALLNDNDLTAALFRLSRYHHINNTAERTAELKARAQALAAEKARRLEQV